MKIIRNSIIPLPGYKAVNLFGVLFVRKEARLRPDDIRHERIHTAQMKETLYVPFYIWYAVEWLLRLAKERDAHKAYRSILFEQEAYGHQSEQDYLERRKPYAWFAGIRVDG